MISGAAVSVVVCAYTMDRWGDLCAAVESLLVQSVAPLEIVVIIDHNPELLFTVETYHISMRRDKKESICEATVRVRVGDEVAHTVAEGDGPVNALDGALRAALGKLFPRLKNIHLIDYKVRILDAEPQTVSALRDLKKELADELQDGANARLEKLAGTAAKTRVLITSSDGKREWGTVGVSENIIEASLQALVDSMEYALLKK